jgi:hypothetical protein
MKLVVTGVLAGVAEVVVAIEHPGRDIGDHLFLAGIALFLVRRAGAV